MGDRFIKLIGLLCKYDNVVPLDYDLLQVLKEDIQSTANESVFIKLFKSELPPFGYLHPLSTAVTSLSTAVTSLVRNGFNVLAEDATYRLTPLAYVVEHMSSTEANLNLLRELLKYSDVNAGYSKVGPKKVGQIFGQPMQAGGKKNEFLLLTAVRRGDLKFVNTLLTAGAKVQLPPEQPETLVYAATSGSHHNILKVLIENSADVKTAVNGQTPLMVAAAGVSKGGLNEGSFQQCVELLVPRAQPPPAADEGRRPVLRGEKESKKAKIGPSPECTICLSSKAEVAFIPCGHMCVCSGCTPRAKGKCPVCRASFQSHVKIYLP